MKILNTLSTQKSTALSDGRGARLNHQPTSAFTSLQVPGQRRVRHSSCSDMLNVKSSAPDMEQLVVIEVPKIRPQTSSDRYLFKRTDSVSSENVFTAPNNYFHPQFHLKQNQKPDLISKESLAFLRQIEPSFGRQAITPPPSYYYTNCGEQNDTERHQKVPVQEPYLPLYRQRSEGNNIGRQQQQTPVQESYPSLYRLRSEGNNFEPQNLLVQEPYPSLYRQRSEGNNIGLQQQQQQLPLQGSYPSLNGTTNNNGLLVINRTPLSYHFNNHSQPKSTYF